MYLLSSEACGSSAPSTNGTLPVRPYLKVTYVFGSESCATEKVIEPYFPRHRERDIYVSLLQKTDPPAPDQLLKAALVRRAVTNVSRIMRLREDKPALQNLLQKGSIGDDLWNSLLAAEKELEAEVLETAAEANTFVEGWGQIIYQTATEVLHNEKMKAIFDSIDSMKAEKGKLTIYMTCLVISHFTCFSRTEVRCQSETQLGSSVKSERCAKVPLTDPCNSCADWYNYNDTVHACREC